MSSNTKINAKDYIKSLIKFCNSSKSYNELESYSLSKLVDELITLKYTKKEIDDIISLIKNDKAVNICTYNGIAYAIPPAITLNVNTGIITKSSNKNKKDIDDIIINTNNNNKVNKPIAESKILKNVEKKIDSNENKKSSSKSKPVDVSASDVLKLVSANSLDNKSSLIHPIVNKNDLRSVEKKIDSKESKKSTSKSKAIEVSTSDGLENIGSFVSANSLNNKSSSIRPIVNKNDLKSFIYNLNESPNDIGGHVALSDDFYRRELKESAFLCQTIDKSKNLNLNLNTHIPFCLVAVGVQGSGKSHTLGCVLESCLIPFNNHGINLITLANPINSLVLHYDTNTGSTCEAAGLIYRNDRLSILGEALPKEKLVILVSPTNYLQRKKFYGDEFIVKPLLFSWKSLSAEDIKILMRIDASDNQLYVANFLTLLRDKYQRHAKVPDYTQFFNEVKKMCTLNSQAAALEQRLNLLSSLIKESECNLHIANEGFDIASSYKNHSLVIADMTNPLLTKEEVNGIFQILIKQFKNMQSNESIGKLLVLDEAHRYMQGIQSDGLSESIVNVARTMRHDNIRLVVSTQSPNTLAPELLELLTIGILHRFHSPDWFTYLSKKLPLPQNLFDNITQLKPGNAILFASNYKISDSDNINDIFNVRIRQRITKDFGKSKTNNPDIISHDI